MITRMMIAAACLLVVASPTLAQQATTAPASVGYTAVITGTDVNVRSGPDLSAYACTKLSAPDRVTVVGQEGTWLKIAPPASCFSVVHKNYLQMDEGGKTATVSSENVWTRAGGDLRTSDFWALQRPLTKGQKVEILAAINDYYKVVAPADSFLYINSQFVKQADASLAATPTTGPAEAMADPAKSMEFVKVSKPVTTTAPADALAAAASVHASLTPASTLSARDQFLAAEKDLQAEFAKSEDKQDFKPLLARYQAIKTAGDPALAQWVGGRVSYLKAAADVRQGNRQNIETIAKAKKDQAAVQEELKNLEAQKAAATIQVPVPAAEGVLQPSVVYSGTSAVQRRYLVCDPATNKVVAFAQSRSMDLQAYAGKCVRVFGATWFDRQTLLDVIEVERLEVLSDETVGMPAPPRPTIKARELSTLAPRTLTVEADQPVQEPAAEPAAAEPAPTE